LKKLKYILLITIAVFTITSNVSADYNSNSILFVNIPNGARETAMGETGVSHSHGGSAAWWNPAFLATDNSEIEFQIFRRILDAKGSFGSARFTTSWGGFGVYYFNQGMNDFEARDRPGPSQGSFSVHQTLFAGGIAFRMKQNIKIGMVCKTALDDIYGDRNDGDYALDFGVGWSMEGWSVGAAIANMELNNDSYNPFPTSQRAGVSYRRQINQFDVLVSGEGFNVLDGDNYFHFGVEAGWMNTLFLRGGYMIGHDSRNVSFGTGVKLKRYSADISITPFSNELGTVWRCGLGIAI